MLKTIVFLLKEILKTVQSTEAKMDALLARQKNPSAPINPMNYANQADPLSNQPIQWIPIQVEDGTQVLVRRSGNQPRTVEMPRMLGEEDR